jgi:hypothetical protein
MTRAALLAALLAACGGDDGVPNYPDAARSADADLTVDATPARETIMETHTLEPGELVEGIMTGGSSDAAQIHLVAPMMLDWNIHSHATGHTVTVYEEYGKVTVDYHFVPPGDGDWYLLVRNSGNVTANIDVQVGLYGNMTWRWQ